MPPLRIADVKAFAVRVPSRDDPYAGTAGLTGEVDSDATCRRVKPYRALCSTHVETVLVRLASDSGLIGWGECQAAVGGRAVQAIVEEGGKPTRARCNGTCGDRQGSAGSALGVLTPAAERGETAPNACEHCSHLRSVQLR